MAKRTDDDTDVDLHDAHVRGIMKAIIASQAPGGPHGLTALAVVEGAVKGAMVVCLGMGCTPAETADLVAEIADTIRQLKPANVQ